MHINDFNYSKLDKQSEIYKLAKRIDSNHSGKIDSDEEKSIFCQGATKLVALGKLGANEFKSVFGFDAPVPKEPEQVSSKPNNVGGTNQSGKSESSSEKPQGDDARNMGRTVYETVHGYTEDYEYNIVNDAIGRKKLDKTNVVQFLDGFYSGESHEGIIEYLDDEHDDGAIRMNNKKNIIISLVECAESKGLSNAPEVTALKAILQEYTTGQYREAKDFNNGGEWNFTSGRMESIMAGASAGATAGATIGLVGGPFAEVTVPVGAVYGGTIGAIAGAFDRPTHNETIDVLLKSLHEKIKAQEDS